MDLFCFVNLEYTMLKLSDNPPMLFPAVETLEQIEGRWWIAHTKARNEKALANVIRRWDIPYFLPMREKVSVNRGRKLISLLPLFSGYVFFNGDEETRYQVLTTNRVAQILEVVDQTQLVSELEQIQMALHCHMPLDPHPYLHVGTRCRVRSGSLAGVEGLVVRKQKLTKLVLQVNILGQAAAVEIDGDLLEPLD